MNPNRRKHCFELFGYDFLIDEDFRVWLIEVNTNPYFGIANEYIADLLPKMIDDMTRIVVDPYFPPRNVEDPGRENLFELIYSEQPENMVNKRRPFGLDLMYPIADLKQQIGTVKPRNAVKVRSINSMCYRTRSNLQLRLYQYHPLQLFQHHSRL